MSRCLTDQIYKRQPNVQVSTGTGEGGDLSVVTTEPVWRAVMTRTLAPQLAVSSGKMTVAPDLLTLAKFFSFFEFE